jgi:hypothetical protein
MAIDKDAAVACTVLNLSLGGALVSSARKTPMGTRAHIVFSIPTLEDPIEIGATVRWVDSDGLGIQFDGLRARDVWGLNKYFEQLLQR